VPEDGVYRQSCRHPKGQCVSVERVIGSYWEDDSKLVTRQVSAENPDGGHGNGARSSPDPADPWLVHSGPAVVLGRGFKVRPYVPLKAGETLTLADLDGPGVVTQLFVTSDLANYEDLRLRCFWDGDETAAVDAPLGAFFGIGHGSRPHELVSAPVQVGPSRGCVSYWPMPYGDGARVTLENMGTLDASVVAYRVAFERGGVPRPLPRFHVSWSSTRTGEKSPCHVILPTVRGRGAYVGTTLYWTAHDPGWWGEGEVKFYLDGDGEFPTIVDNGTEDYFGGAWGFGRDDIYPGAKGFSEREFSGPYSGCPLIETDETGPRRISMYRWHIPDPVRFQQDLRVEVQALGWGTDRLYRVRSDDVASAAYWYAWNGPLVGDGA
jgi:hypothetical protein